MSDKRVLLIGDLMIDRYLWGRCERISPEAPVPVVDIEKETKNLGGAGNVINNLLALDTQVTVVSVVGDDDAGRELSGMLESLGATTSGLVVQAGRKTSRKTRIIATHQQMIRYDSETKSAVDNDTESKLLATVEKEINSCDIILLSDYNKGVLTPSICAGIIKLATERGKKVLADPKGLDYSKYTGAFLITPNRKEAGEAVGRTLESLDDVRRAGLELRDNFKFNYAVITLSEEGMAVVGDEMHHIPTRAREVFDVTGAGDTVLASIGYALVNGRDIDQAARFANEAAAVVVAKVGAATATLAEIEAYEEQNR